MKIGNTYSCAEIADKLGGSTRVFAPFVNNRTTCICLDVEKNPSAPNVILPQGGLLREKMVYLISQCSNAFPLFIRRGNKAWEYMGTLKFDKVSRNKAEIAKHHQGSISPIDTIIAVIYMK
jgi:hypothetical protein